MAWGKNQYTMFYVNSSPVNVKMERSAGDEFVAHWKSIVLNLNKSHVRSSVEVGIHSIWDQGKTWDTPFGVACRVPHKTTDQRIWRVSQTSPSSVIPRNIWPLPSGHTTSYRRRFDIDMTSCAGWVSTSCLFYVFDNGFDSFRFSSFYSENQY